jgi:hypothetical protein
MNNEPFPIKKDVCFDLPNSGGICIAGGVIAVLISYITPYFFALEVWLKVWLGL